MRDAMLNACNVASKGCNEPRRPIRRTGRHDSVPVAGSEHAQLWLRMAVLFAIVYPVVGITFGALRPPTSPRHLAICLNPTRLPSPPLWPAGSRRSQRKARTAPSRSSAPATPELCPGITKTGLFSSRTWHRPTLRTKKCAKHTFWSTLFSKKVLTGAPGASIISYLR
jgi:hypothetical protein